MRRPAASLLGIVLIVAVTGVAVASAQRGVVARMAALAEDLPPYGDELRSLPPYGDVGPEAGRAYTGPGWYARYSHDGRYVAVTESWGGPLAYSFVGLVLDRPFLHTVGVFDAEARRLTRVVSIKEADPHSGIAHRYAWSRDSRALLIHGGGGLPDDYNHPVKLCLVYLPATDQLFRLSRCPAY